jgi:steroid delta-isomerase
MNALPEGPLRRLVAYYETLTRDTVAKLGDVYSDAAAFKDPFNDVRGIEEVRRVLMHMFDDLTDARFAIREAVAEDKQAFLVWDFTFKVRRWQPEVERRIHGASHVRFDAAGKVDYHRDYWDAGEELYEKLPVFGAVVRWVRRKMGQ